MAKAKAKSGKMKDLKARKTITAREAATVKGGRKAGKPQQEYLVVKMNDVIVSG
jgi:hypothetical protein